MCFLISRMKSIRESTKAIIIFTCDQSASLDDTLDSLVPIDIPIIILDDSDRQTTKHFVVNKFSQYSSIYYHSLTHQEDWAKRISKPEFYLFVAELGQNWWTLGYNRNYSLLLSAALSFEKILWIDDDISVRDCMINRTFSNLEEADFAGADITGMPDNSVVGHMRSQFELDPNVFLLSGGFLGINMDSIHHYCLNCHNEDWIWMALHQPDVNFKKSGSVIQKPFNPFSSGIELALWQELGEIIKIGVLFATERNKKDILYNEEFWDSIKKKSLERITDVYMHSLESHSYRKYTSICDALYTYYGRLHSLSISSIFESYKLNLSEWLNIIEEVRNDTTPNPELDEI